MMINVPNLDLLPYVSDTVPCAPSHTSKPYVSDPTLNIPKGRRTANLKLKRSVSEINHLFDDSVQEKLKKRKAVKKSKTDVVHPFISSLRWLQVIPLPVEFRNKIEELRGFDIEFVIQKELTPTDVNTSHASLSLPGSIMRGNKILTDQEQADLETKVKGKLNELAVPLIDPELKYMNMSLKRWNMVKGNGTNNSMYVLTSGWNSLVAANRFHAGDVIQLWSFRVKLDNEDLPPQLHFALVRV